MIFGNEKIEIKSREQIKMMRAAGQIVATALTEVRDALRPGLSALALDDLARTVILDHGARPSFLGYQGFPNSLCISINEEVIHGIPSERLIAEGDIVSFDCGAIVDGWHADSALTAIAGSPGLPEHSKLLTATYESLWRGIAAMTTGRRVKDIGIAVEEEIDRHGDLAGWDYGIVEEYVGHGVGSTLHQAPDVHNFSVRGRSPKLRPGMCLAIEPMITLGNPAIELAQDGWTVRTLDKGLSAHFEHTIAILDTGICVLTASDAGASELELFGITVVEP